jgi:pimeloyl-ACP methyl ester carboxylesterase
LAVVVLHPRSGEPLPAPVMYLDGGPGVAQLNGLLYSGYREYAKPVLDSNRSIIFFTQRGVYPAEPGIAPCDLDYVAARNFFNESNETTHDTMLATWSACFDQLAQTIDLSAYHSTAIAADANDIRRALGYEQVDLWGGSYGSRVGLTILRDYPDSVRAAILEKPVPLDVNLEVDMPGHRAAALERMFVACAADATCAEMAPDLRATFFETVAALNADPLVLTRDVLESSELLPYVVDGRRFASFINVVATPYLRYFPKVIMEASEGRFVEAMDALWGPQWHYEGVNPLYEIAFCNEERGHL